MIVAAFTATVVLVMDSVTTAAMQTHRIAHSLQLDAAEASMQLLLCDDALTWLDAGAPGSGDRGALRARDARLGNLVSWGTGLNLQSITRSEPTGTFFAKGVLLSARPGGNATHPLEVFSGVAIDLGLSLAINGSYLGSVSLYPVLTLRETPACDVGFISAGVFHPASDSTPISVNGTAYLPVGADSGAAAGKLTAGRLVAPALPDALAGISSDRRVNPLFRGSWGWPTLPDLAAPINLPGAPAPQGYFHGAGATLSIQATGLDGATISGVSYREFPSGGPKRLVITLADLPGDLTRLYVNCESLDARTKGIVVIGDPSNGVSVARSIGTNGGVWLWGDNHQPVAIGSPYGQWTLTDANWTETAGNGLPALHLTWAGHIFSPVTTTFNTPQTGAGAQLILNGSLTAGPCEGDLSAISITQQAASPLRQLVERVAYLYHFNP